MKEEYARVGVPMLPVVRGEDTTRRWIFGSTLILVASTLAPYFTRTWAGGTSPLPSSSVASSSSAPALLLRHPTRQLALRVYLYSLLYLALIFGAMVCDTRL